MTRPRTSALVMATGFAIAASVQMVVPVVSPLFDGVVVEDPYRYLAPPPGADGSPTSAASTLTVTGGASPAFAVYTGETPPQAELLGRGGELAIRAATTSLKVSIDPIPSASGSSSTTIAGNLYHFSVTDPSGAAVGLVPGQTLTIALRAPDGISADATIARFANGTAQAVPTSPSGLKNLFITDAIQLGDYAVLGAVAPAPPGFDPLPLVAGLVVAGVVALVLIGRVGIPGRRTRGSSDSKGSPHRPGPSQRGASRRGTR